MKIVTWNVNGLRACMGKGLPEYFNSANADIIAIQETKVNQPIPEAVPPGYDAVWYCGERLGYSGVACLFKTKPETVMNGLGDLLPDEYEDEGRVITLKYSTFYFINVYVPSSKSGTERLDRYYYRLDWDAALAEWVENLQKTDGRPIIIAGDFNVAREYIDVFPENLRNIENPAGFTAEERDGLNALLNAGFLDVYRELHPAQEGAYTWWSQRLHKRNENRGWRIDYILVSNKLRRKVKTCEIRADVGGSDHAPVEMGIRLS